MVFESRLPIYGVEEITLYSDLLCCALTMRVAERTRRRPQTVLEWLHLYNTRGPEALTYQRTGGRPPFARRSKPASAKQSVPPSAQPQPRR